MTKLIKTAIKSVTNVYYFMALVNSIGFMSSVSSTFSAKATPADAFMAVLFAVSTFASIWVIKNQEGK